MPDKKTIERARADKRAGKSPSTQAGEFVREEVHHIREGKHGAESTKQAIGLALFLWALRNPRGRRSRARRLGDGRLATSRPCPRPPPLPFDECFLCWMHRFRRARSCGRLAKQPSLPRAASIPEAKDRACWRWRRWDSRSRNPLHHVVLAMLRVFHAPSSRVADRDPGAGVH